MNHDRQGLHVVFGAGQVGLKLAHLLVDRGHDVRIIRRGAAGAPREGLTWMSGDVTDRHFADEAAAGAAVVYDCVNPPDYSKWQGVLEPLRRSVRGAAARAGARLVVLDCLYMYGAPNEVPFDESTPMRPCSSKGELRAMLAEELFEAHRRGDVEATTGRASDFFGPESPNSMVFHPRVVERLRSGKRIEVLGDPDTPHAYNYTPDVARALVELGTRDEAVGRAFHLPAAWTSTTRELIERAGELVGKPASILRVPPWALSVLGVVVPEVRAIRQMLYQWDEPFVLDDSCFRSTFGVQPTPIDEALRDTLGISDPALAA